MSEKQYMLLYVSIIVVFMVTVAYITSLIGISLLMVAGIICFTIIAHYILHFKHKKHEEKLKKTKAEQRYSPFQGKEYYKIVEIGEDRVEYESLTTGNTFHFRKIIINNKEISKKEKPN